MKVKPSDRIFEYAFSLICGIFDSFFFGDRSLFTSLFDVSCCDISDMLFSVSPIVSSDLPIMVLLSLNKLSDALWIKDSVFIRSGELTLSIDLDRESKSFNAFSPFFKTSNCFASSSFLWVSCFIISFDVMHVEEVGW